MWNYNLVWKKFFIQTRLSSGFIIPRFVANSERVLRIFAQDVPPKMPLLYVVENWSRDVHRKTVETWLVLIRIFELFDE